MTFDVLFLFLTGFKDQSIYTTLQYFMIYFKCVIEHYSEGWMLHFSHIVILV